MIFKNLLVFIDGADDSLITLEVAATMAESWDARLTVVAVTAHPSFNLGYQSMATSQLYFKDVERAHAQAAELAETAKAFLVEKGLSGTVRWGSDTQSGLSEIAAIHSYGADLVLVSQPGEDEFGPLRAAVFEGVLFDSGRPVVVVPRGWAGGAFGKQIMVAWLPSREAARAIHDAKPFILAAGRATIAVVDPSISDREYGEEPGADIAAALARHGVEVTVDQLPRSDRSVAEAIREHAVSCSADLIVMGGYGHSRLREAIIGGVTRDMIANTSVPLLISH
jgi:nucleotide-binding universal stress UspA family protein